MRHSLEQRFLEVTSRLDGTGPVAGAEATIEPAGGGAGGEGRCARALRSRVAAQMIGADFLKLRKKRGTLIWALVLALAPLLIFFVVSGIQHASNPAEYGPAGGVAELPATGCA